jgi:histidinol dehydrogenase
MKFIDTTDQNKQQEDWKQLLQRPTFESASVRKEVSAILNDVKQHGDDAIKKYTVKFDGVELNDLTVNEKEFSDSFALVSDDLKRAIKQAAANINTFHSKQHEASAIVETMPGVQCWRKSIGIEKVGLYIPGGTAPLFSTVLMLGIPAMLAGCKEIILCSPPDKKGELNPAILFAAHVVGITKIFKVGGVQAIAALAYGTDTIPAVYKIFGPGNQYVTCAKQIVQEDGIAIDMPAGPSEVCVLADATAHSAFVAADLLSQAEHGADSQVLLITNSRSLISDVEEQIKKQLEHLSRKEIASKALENSKLIFVQNLDEAIVLVNEYAPEHLIIACENEDAIAEKIINAGSVFLGNYSPETAGDYASGTNHTLPTNGFAKTYSGLSVDSFIKKITYQKLTKQGLKNISNTVLEMANAEGLRAHANAVTVRMNS